MKTNEITIETVRNMDPATKKLINRCRAMTPEPIDLLIDIIDLTAGQPARMQFALNWSGPAKDLPAALARI